MIATVYTESVTASALLVAAALFAVTLVVRALRIRVGAVYLALGVAIWVALLESGVEPVIVGLAMGLLDVRVPGGPVGPRSGGRAVPPLSRATDA